MKYRAYEKIVTYIFCETWYGRWIYNQRCGCMSVFLKILNVNCIGFYETMTIAK